MAAPGSTWAGARHGPSAAPPGARLRELALLFLKLGTIAFGGPAAHIAMMEDEVVRRRGWLTREEFLDLLGATNLIPGPNSTELAIHIGRMRAGWPGLIVAGACFILPAALIVTAFAWMYVRYGALPETGDVLYGIKPVIIAIVVQAIWGLTRSAVKTPTLGAVGLAALALTFARVNELWILFGAGIATALFASASATGSNRPDTERNAPTETRQVPAFGPANLTAGTAAASVLTGGAAFNLWSLFLFFVKVGSVLFGSGYVLLAFLRADLVERWHWLTDTQLLDAIIVGQVTPGPVFTTATFIGYVLGGGPGALVATVGIFLPAFVFVAISGPLVPRIRRSPVAGAFLDGVNVASLALMAFVTYELAQTAFADWLAIAMAVVSGVILLRWRINSGWLVLAAALIGLLLSRA